ncbi:hypothetical protein ACI3ET_13260 [Ornithinimicrobium sp. LYQ121]|uniref:hypothetical protein n=1 Tax=Ornithinimicrobium sp. LYQ121 TaxID=3378801 RepID=UPI0038526BBA
MKSSSLKKTAIEGVKYTGGLPWRRAAAEMSSFTESTFWDYQRVAFRRRYVDALNHVPYYQTSGLYPQSLPWEGGVIEAVRHLPLLSKETVKQNTNEFVRAPQNPLSATHSTGGTTGTPLIVRAGLFERGWTNAILEQRNVVVAGVRNPRTVRLSGFLAAPTGAVSETLPGTNIAYLSIYSLSEMHREQVTRFLQDFRPRLFHGYASALTQLARLMGPKPVDLGAVAAISTSETLSPSDRDQIEDSLGIRVYNEYGSQEGQHLILECAQRCMHIHPARGIVEILNLHNDEPATVGTLGRVVVTGLLAREFPLFRYDIGDTAVSTGYASDCPCGLGWPTVGTVHGRTEDLVRTKDGRRIGLLAHSTLKDVSGVAESQIVQRGYDQFVYRIRCEPGADIPNIERHVREQLERRLAYSAHVTFEYLDQPVERTKGGKLKAVVVDFSVEEP